MDTNAAISHDELLALNQKYREIKHDINNTLAVFIAQAEMGKIKPEYQEKLIKAVLTRCPLVVAQMMEFQKLLTDKISATAPPARPQPAPAA